MFHTKFKYDEAIVFIQTCPMPYIRYLLQCMLKHDECYFFISWRSAANFIFNEAPKETILRLSVLGIWEKTPVNLIMNTVRPSSFILQQCSSEHLYSEFSQMSDQRWELRLYIWSCSRTIILGHLAIMNVIRTYTTIHTYWPHTDFTASFDLHEEQTI